VVEIDAPLSQGGDKSLVRYFLPIVYEHLFDGILTGTSDLRIAEVFGRLIDATPCEALFIYIPEQSFDNFSDLHGGRQPEFHQIIKTAEQRLIQPLAIVRGGNDNAVAAQSFDENKEGIEDTPHFSNIVWRFAREADAVEFIEEIDGSRGFCGLEN
jgi:hypothetical protein